MTNRISNAAPARVTPPTFEKLQARLKTLDKKIDTKSTELAEFQDRIARPRFPGGIGEFGGRAIGLGVPEAVTKIPVLEKELRALNTERKDLVAQLAVIRPNAGATETDLKTVGPGNNTTNTGGSSRQLSAFEQNSQDQLGKSPKKPVVKVDKPSPSAKGNEVSATAAGVVGPKSVGRYQVVSILLENVSHADGSSVPQVGRVDFSFETFRKEAIPFVRGETPAPNGTDALAFAERARAAIDGAHRVTFTLDNQQSGAYRETRPFARDIRITRGGQAPFEIQGDSMLFDERGSLLAPIE